MKTMKYLLLGAMMTAMTTTAVAQTGTEEDVNTLKALVASKPADYDKQAKAYVNKNKKNAENLIELGRVFYGAKDYENATACAKQALSTKKNSYAPAFVLLGDIAAMQDNGGEAATNYDQAIWADPKDPTAYRKYAAIYRKISPDGAIEKLEELRKEVPSYPVDALIGHISYISQRYATAIDAYSKVPTNDLSRMDFIEYARSLQLAGKFQESQDVVVKGLAKDPNNATLNRFAMMNSNDLKKYDDALKYADILFNKVDKDSVNLSELDYQNYGKAYEGTGNYDKAIELYKKASTLPDVDNATKSALLKSVSDSYKKLNDYPNAIDTYQQYLKADESVSAAEYAGLGILIGQYARTLTGEEKNAMLSKADQTYAELITKFPDAEEYGLWQRGRMNAQIDDKLTGLAKPHFEKLITLVTAHETLDDSDKTRLWDAYSYLMRYELKKKNNAEALNAAKKLQELRPEDADIKNIVNTLSKTVK